MRIAAFDDERVGIVADDETMVDITDLLQQYEPLDAADLLPDLITHFDALRPELERRKAAGVGKPLTEVRLRSPLTRPSKIICLMGNYREGTDRPLQIIDLFFKSPEGISGPGDTVVIPPHQADIFHHEAELGVVIGREAKDLSEAEAMDAVFGYVAYNDVSARGLGRPGINSFLGKSFDTFAGFGPWIVTKDEIPDPQSLHVTVDVNGERRQDYSDERHGAPGPRSYDLYLVRDEAPSRRRHLHRDEPSGPRLDAGRRHRRHHGLGSRFFRLARA